MNVAVTPHLVAALAAVLVIGLLGRLAARRLRQPEVIGEIVAGLLAGPATVALLGPTAFGTVLFTEVLPTLRLLAEAGLVLFLVGLAHKLRLSGNRPSRRTVGWVVAGGFLPPLLSGVVFGCWLLSGADPAIPRAAPVPALLLMCAVALSVTAVPVLARILGDRGMEGTVEGRLAMTAAVIIDIGAWLLLSIAVGLASGHLTGFLRTTAVFGGGAAAALLLRSLLRGRVARALCARWPKVTAVVLAATALVTALTVDRLGLTAIFGAVLVGLAVPVDGAWTTVVGWVTRAGRVLVPVFFVVTGLTVLPAGMTALPWATFLVGTLLAIAGKGGGTYLGSRLAGVPRRSAATVGVLMNTRGLTELIVLKVGLTTGLITAPVFLALVMTAVATTVLTGPLLLVIDRRAGSGSAGRVSDHVSAPLQASVPARTKAA